MNIDTLELQKEIIRLLSLIRKNYLGDDSPIPEEKLPIAYMYLQEDISSSLALSDNIFKRKAEIENLLKNSFAYDRICKLVSLDSAFRKAIVRKDFEGALSTVSHGSTILYLLGYSLSENDIRTLTKLHKSNRYRRKIEELLMDYGFHLEGEIMQTK